MLMVDKTMVGVHASKLEAMTELGILINAMANKGIIDKEDALTIVDAAFMSEEDLHKKAEEVKSKVKEAKKAMDDKLKELLKEMLEELE